ncbi:MAG: hypothetical protein ABIG37_01295, partial [Nanoarchaeota archaeon]|nr:hypothetical protein [Nanoarchaeota archaeon]
MEKQTEYSLEEKQAEKFILKNKTFLMVLSLLILLFVAWNIRTVNLDNLKDITTGDYTLGPD